MLDSKTALAGLPTGLRTELLQAFEAISQNYSEHKWEPSELNGGKFCEVVYCIAHGAIIGSMPVKAKKPANMVGACRDLEKIPANATLVGDRSFRVLIPRVLLAIYEIRNNRNVGHVGGDVDPNFMDATVVHGMASWVLGELVRIYHSVSTKDAQAFVDALVERKHPLIWEVGNIRRVLAPEMKVRDKTLVLLHGKASWVAANDLSEWTEYSTLSNFRTQILSPLHKIKYLEFDQKADQAKISPLGVKYIENFMRIFSGGTP